MHFGWRVQVLCLLCWGELEAVKFNRTRDELKTLSTLSSHLPPSSATHHAHRPPLALSTFIILFSSSSLKELPGLCASIYDLSYRRFPLFLRHGCGGLLAPVYDAANVAPCHLHFPASE